MSTIRLTLAGKIVIFLLIVSIVGSATYFLGGFDSISNLFDKKVSSNAQTNTGSELPKSNSKDDSTIVLSLDEWIGWKSILDANGGLETKEGSIFSELGINVKILIMNEATQSSNALIKGDLNGAGYTVNRYAFLYDKFKRANLEVVMPYITNSSTGGDGIIAKKNINSIEDLIGKKIGVPRFSEAQTLIEWLLSKSSLSSDQVNQLRKSMVFFDTPDDAAKAFFAGKIDAAGTWQPYLTQAQQTTGAKVLFSTKTATNIILDGIVFRKDFVDNNKETIQKFIEGTLKAEKMYKTDFNAIKDSMPLFTTETDENILSMTADATLSNATVNKKLLDGIAQSLFRDMSQIWIQLGESANPDYADKAFDNSFVNSIATETTVETEQVPKFTEKQRNAAKAQDNMAALLKTSLTVNFEPNLAVIKEESYESLNKFADTAKILNGAIIQIEGNVSAVGKPTPEYDQKLSYQRAKAVATYLQVQGVDPSRFVIIGNGTSKQISDNKTKEGQLKNRRTDMFFKLVE